ncbi:hypothetical protein G6F56_010613 [Rhizopus delemar]|uniref:BZIP domain-containing protein n=1 Tax=Rhizopus stolonifer TaxID=4846 RepID=A0A367INA1_RHIST|nr:hypothetical protein G6F56_010613 [Rhizopus delemar]RCH79170.1 hypothetical protein CU098_001680 [Rhizopus stolonifer]
MEDVVINTSSYEEAMNLSDMEEFDFSKESISDTGLETETTLEPIKIRKKPGRKPNPASPALRKAQNRAAQRAFRERKERHTKELESSIRDLKEERDKLLKENEVVVDENEILKAENWYLKGIVLSLQLVCMQHRLVIPQHCPHINDETLSVLAQSIPQSISSYLNVNAKNKLELSSRFLQRTNKPYDSLQEKQFQAPTPATTTTTDMFDSYNSNQYLDEIYLRNMPSLSPMTENIEINKSPEQNQPATSNLAAIQSLRLQLRMQASGTHTACVPTATQPTLLQLAIPHDPRIDLVPTSHMRDRMILFRDLFDLDDCFRCLLDGSVFHGGDPAIAGNWQIPAEFFEKYWFLTIDYDLRRYTNKWRKKQGLEEIHSPSAAADIPNSRQPTTQLEDEFNMMGLSSNQQASPIWDDFSK